MPVEDKIQMFDGVCKPFLSSERGAYVPVYFQLLLAAFAD